MAMGKNELCLHTKDSLQGYILRLIETITNIYLFTFIKKKAGQAL
jgi:hypothetical protein